MYKVYIDNKVVVFSSAPVSRALYMEPGLPGDLNLTKLLQNLQITKCLNVLSDDEDKVFEDFFSSQKVIEAAGGLVTDIGERVLMIFRNGRWDLPKGKMEGCEDHLECALREVAEECSVSDMIAGNFITHTYHCYRIGPEWVLKRTWWYSMFSPGGVVPVPQSIEGITEARWIDADGIPAIMEDTYGNIRDVFRAAGYPVKDKAI